jgi:hypothetical protein
MEIEMSEEDIRHIYCNGEGCCESIDGYNPHAKNIDAFIAKDLEGLGWVIIKEDDVIGGYFCGIPLVIDNGETKHFCPKCKLLEADTENRRDKQLKNACDRAKRTGRKEDLAEYLKMRKENG